MREAHARGLLRETATIGILALIPSNYIIYRDPADLVTQLLVNITTDWDEHQKNPELPPFFSEVAWEFEARVSQP